MAGRGLGLARLDAERAREIFIRRALVDGDWEEAPELVSENISLLQHLRSVMQRARRPDLMVGDEALVDFYDRRLGPDVVSGRTLEAWWRRHGAAERAALVARVEDSRSPEARGADPADFPDNWSRDGASALALRYNWEPGAPDDGVVVEVPLAELDRVAEEGLEWQVPGLRHELVVSLLRSLPKEIRRHLVPVPTAPQISSRSTVPGTGLSCRCWPAQ